MKKYVYHKWTTLIISKDQKDRLQLAMRRLGLRYYREAIEMFIQNEDKMVPKTRIPDEVDIYLEDKME